MTSPGKSPAASSITRTTAASPASPVSTISSSRSSLLWTSMSCLNGNSISASASAPPPPQTAGSSRPLSEGVLTGAGRNSGPGSNRLRTHQLKSPDRLLALRQPLDQFSPHLVAAASRRGHFDLPRPRNLDFGLDDVLNPIARRRRYIARKREVLQAG